MDCTLKIENIFWHEVGHYFAQQLNKKYYGKFGCQGIRITKVDENGIIRYTGGATPVTPPNHDPKSLEIKHPASSIGSLVYGCIFQSCFLRTPFAACFAEERFGVNGFHDYNGVWATANIFFLSKTEKDELDTLITQQFEIVCSNLSQAKIFDIDISAFFTTNKTNNWIPVEELDEIFSTIIDQHGPIYKNFVDKIAALFESKKQFIPKSAEN
ncbi:hypothetical protein [Chitinophaga sp.]|uniref:hypothetical protein n=1 Tax=Chitinophaga sp. TaxID=1869181 RepID=UPI0031E0407C